MRLLKQLFLAMLVSLFLSSVAMAAAVAEFKKVRGVVDIFHAGERKAKPAAVGVTMEVGDTVRTGRRSRAQLQLADGSVLNIGSLSKIKIGEFSFDADKKIRKSTINDLRGKVRAVVSKSTNKNSFFQIKTPGAVAAVRGTHYGVDAISPHEAIVVTYDGAVEVSNRHRSKQNNSVIVRANQYTRIVSNKAPTTPVTAPASIINNMSSGTQQASSGSGGPASNSGSVGSGSGTTAAAAPVADTASSTSGGGSTGSTTVPQTATPAVQLAAPVIAPPPITLTTPAVLNQNVNIVIQF